MDLFIKSDDEIITERIQTKTVLNTVFLFLNLKNKTKRQSAAMKVATVNLKLVKQNMSSERIIVVPNIIKGRIIILIKTTKRECNSPLWS